jgi:hypothetical protein
MIKEMFDGVLGFPTFQDAKDMLLDELSEHSELNYEPIDILSLIKSSGTFVLTEEGYFGQASEGVRQGE